MKKEIKAAEEFRRTAFISEGTPGFFTSCWLGGIIGQGRGREAMVRDTVSHLRVHGVCCPTIITVDIKGRRQMKVAR